MSQWQQIQCLQKGSLDRVHNLYMDDCLPMEVRQYLAYWIEDQNWSQAAESNSPQARWLFQTMLALLDDQLGRFVLGEENNSNMLLKYNLHRAKVHLKATYEENPEKLANIIKDLLKEEQRILAEALAVSQSNIETPPNVSVTTSPQHNIDDRLAEVRRTVQGLKNFLDFVEDQQDIFDFRYRTHKILEDMKPSDPGLAAKAKELQVMIHNLDRYRKELLAKIQELLGRSDTLRNLLLLELDEWRTLQRQACIGAPCDTSLLQLEKWFTGLAEELFHLLQLLKTLKEHSKKLTYQGDAVAFQLPLLKQRLHEQMVCLLKSAFVVEVQPSMPFPCHRPLVLKTSYRFAIRVRLLVKLLDRNHKLELAIEIDRFRRFNIMTSNSKTMVMDKPQTEGLICNLQHMMLKEQKHSCSGKGKDTRGAYEGALPVTEEFHVITFTLDYRYDDFKCNLETSTLPVVIISNSNQMSAAWASILWFNMLGADPNNQLFFANAPMATWSQLSVVLQWQFSAATKRDLSADQLKMLGEKVCEGQSPEPNSTITWAQFSKVTTPKGFSFWAWLDGILGLIQDHLLELWKNGLIMGFVSHKRERHLLKKKRAGTFLLRFSESCRNGGITCTWVEYNSDGTPNFRSVVPYTRDELKDLALADIIRDYQLLAVEDIPENPLQFLYPDLPRDEAFGPYYSQKRDENLLEQKYLNRRLIRVSRQPEDETQVLPVEDNDVVPLDDVSLFDDSVNELGRELEVLLSDPFLSVPDEEQQQLVQNPLFEFPVLTVDYKDFHV